MSHTVTQEQESYLVAGVIKIDFKAAGWKDLMEVAKEWAKDPRFHEIIVRHVSEKNLGIQFVYVDSEGKRGKGAELVETLKNRFGQVYAWDVSEVGQASIEEALDGVVVLKGISQKLDCNDGPISCS